MLAETLSAYVTARQRSPPLPAGSAPHTSSNSFKINASNGKASAKRWDQHFSSESAKPTSSTLKAASKVCDPKAMISLGTARPAPEYYPWKAVTMNAIDTTSLDEKQRLNTADTACLKGEAAYDLGLVMNYGYAAGSPQLLRFITEHVEMIHDPPYQDWECSLTCGTTSAIDICFRMLCDRGQSILSEEYTYPGTITAAKNLGLNLVGVKMDVQGLMPDHLHLKLRDWGVANGPRPKILYTIPSGQNPTGSTQDIERRKAIYAIAEEYDLLIIEDDPYYFIQLANAPGLNGTSTNTIPSSERYLQNLPLSYLSLDVSGRVIRLDATSKILAPGLRCGWITACTQIIQKFIHHTELSTIAPSGPSQMMLYKLLDESWGHEGFIYWLQYLSSQYQRRLHTLVTACTSSLPSGLCRWTVPSAGMFLWVHIDWSKHPLRNVPGDIKNGQYNAIAIEDQIYLAARNQGVLVSRGSWFITDEKLYRGISIRLTFAAASDRDLKDAVHRLGKALRQIFQIPV